MPEARNHSVGIQLGPSNVIRGNEGINAGSRLRRPDGALELRETLRHVLRTLHERGRLCRGMASLLDADSGDLLVAALHDEEAAPFEKIRYRPGEGVIGQVLETNRRWILPRVSDKPRFLDRLGLFDPDLPFIGVPIRIGEDDVVGVFALQPPANDALM
ncbi:hypothetical protein CKO31_23535, partial [Thiohalocapsa halophila]|nr:hypothetical protein [Thiohalocapsa halophila]